MSDGSVSPDDALPRRTWQQWWIRLPGYWRIAAWSLVVCTGLNVLLVVRLLIGLQESPEITRFRQRAEIMYFWEPSGEDVEPFRGHGLLMSGLLGRSGRNIDFVNLKPDASDEDLAFIGKHCRNIRGLHARYSKVTAEGIKAIQPCRRLTDFSLLDANISDDAIPYLKVFSELVSLDVGGTCITDAAIPTLKRLPRIEYVNITGTEISIAAIQEWDEVLYDNTSSNWSDRTKRNNFYLRANLLWEDDSSPVRFTGPTRLTFSRLEEGNSTIVRELTSDSATRSLIDGAMTGWVLELWVLPDGDYEFSLTLGENTSAPFVISFEGGYPSTHDVEFRMPVTNAHSTNTNRR